jgi:hypothetical protein
LNYIRGISRKVALSDVFFIVLDWIFGFYADTSRSIATATLSSKVAKGRMVDSLVDGFFVDSIMLKRDLKRDYIT